MPAQAAQAPPAVPVNRASAALAASLSARRILGWAVAVIREARMPFIASLAASLLILLTTQFNVQVLANLISVLGTARPDAAAAGLDAVAFAVSSALVITLTVASRMLTAWSDTVMLARLQQTLHDKLLALGPEGRVRYGARTASSLVLQAAPVVQPILRDVVATPLSSAVAMVSALGLLAYNIGEIGQAPWPLEAALVLLVVLLPVGAVLVSGRLRAAYDAYGHDLDELGQELANSVTDIAEIALLGARTQRSRRFAARLRDAAAGRLAAVLRLEAEQQFQVSLPIIVQAAFLIYAAYQLLGAGPHGDLGGILAIYYFAPAAVRPLQTLLGFHLQVSANRNTVAQVGEVLDATGEPPPMAPATAAPHRAADVALAEVGFAFARQAPPSPPLLHDLSHVFPAGSVTAIVGRSGSGKSTLLSLLAGLHLPASGTVLVDGAPPRARPGAVALVSQTPLIIADTVRENFRLAAADTGDAEIEAACRELGLWPLLQGLAPAAPLDAVLSVEPGQDLSAGARRLLAVGRALLRGPRVLLLDEPTAGVDVAGRDALVACIRRAAPQTTVIVVEHDIDFICRLEGTVCCLEDGCFAAVGSAEDLAQRSTPFRNMVRSRAALLATDRLSISSVPLPLLAAPQAARGAA